MTASRSRRVIGFSLLLFFLAALSAHAAEEGGDTAAARANELFKWINFAIVAAVLIWVFAKALPPKFQNKADAISSAIAKATVAKAEADRQLREAEEKLTRLPEEIKRLQQTAEREAAAEGDRIHAMTRTEIQNVHLAAKAEIEAAERAAHLELKVIAANLAVDGAESILVQELTPKTQESLVTAFVNGLEARPN